MAAEGGNGPGGGAAAARAEAGAAARSSTAGALARSSTKGSASGKQVKADPSVVIFLDVDGVLHSLCGAEFFREECMRAFEQIVMRSNASVVLSSTWRLRAQAMTAVNAELRKRGLAGIRDRTPDFGNRPREEEVLDWLSHHPDVQHWIAIDDLDLADRSSPHHVIMRGHFLKTESSTGLLRHVHVEKALQMLKNSRGEVPAPSGQRASGLRASHTRPL